MIDPHSSRPTFSVVIPAHNRSDLIAPTLKSVQEQSFSDFECIVVDDGSADSEALRAVVGVLGDPRFRYVWRENGGGGAARNTGIEQSRGRYIAFLDSDDFFLPSKLEAFASRMSEDEVDKAGYSYLLSDRGVGRYWRRPDRPIRDGEDMGEYLFVHNQIIQTSTIVLHRQAALRTMFDPSLKKGQDLDLCLRLHRDGVRFFMIEEPLVIWSDITEVGRTSRTEGYKAPLAWLERSRPLLSKAAERGYRSTVLAYYLAKQRPIIAAKDLLLGWALAGVPGKITLRQMLRSYLPRSTYRTLVNRFVQARGSGKSGG